MDCSENCDAASYRRAERATLSACLVTATHVRHLYLRVAAASFPVAVRADAAAAETFTSVELVAAVAAKLAVIKSATTTLRQLLKRPADCHTIS